MGNTTMDLGRVGIWTGVLDAVSSKEAQRAAAVLEDIGFPTLWIPETVGRDPFVDGGAAAVGHLPAEAGDGHRQHLRP